MNRFALLIVVALLPLPLAAAPGEFVITDTTRGEFVLGEIAAGLDGRDGRDGPSQVATIAKPAARPALEYTPTGYLWTFDDARRYKETFPAYYQRTGKLPPQARRTCSTGYCGTFTSRPTIATGGCKCGCKAGTCNCHHAPNAGLPLAAQTYRPGR